MCSSRIHQVLQLVVLILVLLACSPKKEIPYLGLGIKTPNEFEGKILGSSGQFYDNLERKVDGVTYTLGLQDEKVTFISVTDTLFSIDGYRVGDLMPRKGQFEEIGFACIVDINETWSAAASIKCSTKEERITFFFQR